MTRSRCPAHYDERIPYCSATKPEQHRIDAGELRKAGVPEQEEWVSRAWQCRYCKCVYSEGKPPGRKVVRGRLEDGVWTSWDL